MYRGQRNLPGMSLSAEANISQLLRQHLTVLYAPSRNITSNITVDGWELVRGKCKDRFVRGGCLLSLSEGHGGGWICCVTAQTQRGGAHGAAEAAKEPAFNILPWERSEELLVLFPAAGYQLPATARAAEGVMPYMQDKILAQSDVWAGRQKHTGSEM